MTRDDIRKMMGGYATGSLTDAERKFLFEAALEDQELFDELTREHALKELLEEPGAKQRLIAALGRPRLERTNPRLGWRWAAAVTALAGTMAAVVMLWPAKKAPEIAKVLPATPTFEGDKPVPVPSPAPPARRKPAAVKASPAPAPVTAVNGRLAMESAKVNSAALPASRFGFDYALEASGLSITPSAEGYLRVTADSRVLFPTSGVGRVTEGSVMRAELPPGPTEVVIRFARRLEPVPGNAMPFAREDASGTVEDPNPSPDSALILTLRIGPR